MEQVQSGDPTSHDSSVLTPIDNISATHTRRKKRNRRALFDHRKHDINKHRARNIITTPTPPISMSYPPNQSQVATQPATRLSTPNNQHQQITLPESSNQPISKGITTSVSEPDSTITHRYHPSIEFLELQQSVTGNDFDTDWKVSHSDESSHFHKIKMGQMTQPMVNRSVTVNSNMSWHAYAMGKLLTHAT